MAITRVWIEEGCILCACSVSACSDVFKIDNEFGTAVVIKDVDYSKYEHQIKEAAYSCPVEVIKYE